MTKELADFLEDLYTILKKHKGGLFYTTDDDGIHACVGTWFKSESVCIGFTDEGQSEIGEILDKHYSELYKSRNIKH